MKKLLVIPVLILYLLAVSGVMVHAHYCGDNLESWNVYLKGAGCEGGDCSDEEDQSDSCCENKVVVSKISQDQQHTDQVKIKAPLSFTDLAILPHYAHQQEIRFTSLPLCRESRSNAPPGLWEDIPLYKLHSCFTYYG